MSNIAELYRKRANTFEQLVGEIKKYACKGDTVIDLGCGTGPYFEVIEKSVGKKGRIIMTDISKEMVAYCKKKFSGENVCIKRISAERISALKEKADVIFAALAIQFTDEKKTFAEAKKALKDNGVLIFAIPLYRNGITIALDKAGKDFRKEFLGRVSYYLKNAGTRQKATFEYVNDREKRFKQLIRSGGWKILKWSKKTSKKNGLKELLNYYQIPWRSHRILNLPFKKRYAIITSALKDAFRKYPKFKVERHYLLATVRK
jgi:ubiquinone/menaquinone biosynthesis C-methylase UbiE